MREFIIQVLTAFAGGMIAVVFVNGLIAFGRYIKAMMDYGDLV